MLKPQPSQPFQANMFFEADWQSWPWYTKNLNQLKTVDPHGIQPLSKNKWVMRMKTPGNCEGCSIKVLVTQLQRQNFVIMSFSKQKQRETKRNKGQLLTGF